MATHHAFTLATDIPIYFCPDTAATTLLPSPPNSTAAHAKRSAGKPQPKACINHSRPDNRPRIATTPRTRQMVPSRFPSSGDRIEPGTSGL
ncbi:hypothetical protein C8258_04395 [Nocardia sp. MDA0666]|nr:hypothetical protein C8258_04395 [Nocardia sp. MDA0666]